MVTPRELAQELGLDPEGVSDDVKSALAAVAKALSARDPTVPGFEAALEAMRPAWRRDPPSPEEMPSVLRRLAEGGLDLGAPLELGPREGPRPGGGRLGRYRETEEIGRGGMGVVHRGRDVDIGRDVAIKTLLGDAARGSEVRRFLREARVTGQLEHPGIVPVHELEIGRDGLPYFTMKLVRGRSLAERLHDGTDYPVSRRLQDFLKICDAVAYAHSRGVVHRDLKPGNVMIGEFGEVLVVDWGLAGLLRAPEGGEIPPETPGRDAGETVPGSVFGTLAYMPPEQARGEVGRLDARADVYALGATLHEILALAPPFGGTDWVELRRRVLAGEPDPPPLPFPRELEAVVRRAMAPRPEDRYRRVVDLRADVEAWLEGRTLRAATYHPLQRAAKWIARHRAASVALAAVLAVAIGTAAAFRWREARDRRARAAAAIAQARESLADSGGELEGWLEAAGALDRALDLFPEDEEIREERREVGLELGRRLVETGDYTVARRVYQDLARFGATEDEVALRLAELEDARTALLRARRERLLEILLDLREGLSRTDRPRSAPTLDEYLLEACAFDDEGTVVLLGAALDELSAKAEREGRLAAWSEGERDVAVLAASVLGALRREEGLPPLARWLSAVWDPALAAEAGRALASTRLPGAWRALLAARDRFGLDSDEWERIERFLDRLPDPEGLPGQDDPLRRGLLLAARGRFEEALAAYEAAVAAEPGRADAANQRGVALVELARFPEALEAFGRAIELEPGAHPPWVNRGQVRLRLGDVPGALADFDRAVELAPDEPAARVGRASARSRAGDDLGAREDLDRAIELGPGDTDALVNRALLRERTGDLTGGLEDLSRAIEIDPTRPDLRGRRGLLRLKGSDPSGALEDFDRAIQIDPSRATDFRFRAVACRQLGRIPQALEDASRAVRLDPSDLEALFLRAELLWSAGRPVESIADLDRALELDPENVRAHRTRGWCRGERGDVEGALADLGRALELDPGEARSRLFRGRILRGLGRHDEARRDYAEYLRLRPDAAERAEAEAYLADGR